MGSGGRLPEAHLPVGVLLAALQSVAELAPVGSPAHNVAVDTLEQFTEREGITLADWQPDTAPRSRPTLRIVGFAT